jgi:RNA polymerase sigma factor (TIGR02999 family)
MFGPSLRRRRVRCEASQTPSLPMAADEDPTRLLLRAQTDPLAVDALFSRAYDELRAIAHDQVRRQRAGDTLNTTALVHEAYVRLIDQSDLGFNDRAHFLAIASRAMRFVLIDHVRARMAEKRGGGRADVTLDRIELPARQRMDDLLALNEALDRLSTFDPRLGRVVECRFFGGLSYEEVAAVIGASVPTAKRDWRRARAWLHSHMQIAGP